MQLLEALIVLAVVMVGVNKVLGSSSTWSPPSAPSFSANFPATSAHQDVTLPPYSPARLGGPQ